MAPVSNRDFFTVRRLEQVFELIRRILTRPQAVVANTTLTTTNNVVLVTTGAGNKTITLPHALDNASRVYTVKKVDAGIGTVTVTAVGTDTIDGAATVVLLAQWNTVTIISDGANWYKISAI